MQAHASWEHPRVHPGWSLLWSAEDETVDQECRIKQAIEWLRSGQEKLRDAPSAPPLSLRERVVDFSVTRRPDFVVAARAESVCGRLFKLPQRMLGWTYDRLQGLAMGVIYQLSSHRPEDAGTLQAWRATLARHASWLLREVILESEHVRTSGLVICSSETVLNRRWVLQATGSDEPIEEYAERYGKLWLNRGYNTLLVQGPGAPLTEGRPTPFNLGEAQRLGIRFLEAAVQARQIVLAGLSLGGGAIGEAILQHTFPRGEQAPSFQVLRTITFSSMAATASGIVRFPVGWLIRALGCEFQGAEASRCLSELQIPETIVGCGDDQGWQDDCLIRAEASLGWEVERLALPGKTFLRMPWSHIDPRYVRLGINHLAPLHDQPPELVVSTSASMERSASE